MKTHLNSHFFFLFFLIFSLQVIAQEVEVPLQTNAVVAEQWKIYSASNAFKMQAINDTISLPFRDDFSSNGVYPDSNLWIDKNVFINRDYPIAPPTLGVATFEGLDQTGYPYNFTSTGAYGLADYLSSKPVMMGNPLSPGDSVYFSFYYQAKGRGNAPEALDSLVLEFRTAQGWNWVWSKEGYAPSGSDTGFHVVMIPVTDTAYFFNGFSFRFKNYATLSGNLDHWNIDYVYLNASRSFSDTIVDDVAFVYSAPSFLKNYQQMPWEQFQSADMDDSHTMFIRNNGTSANNTTYVDTVKSNLGSQVWTYDGGICQVPPFLSGGYDTCSLHRYPQISFSFTPPVMTDTTSFIAKHILSYTGDVNRKNDTLAFIQKFHNYFAYDDGTAESSYSLNVNNACFSYRLNLNNTDTLRAIQIFFNPVFNSVKGEPFRFAVWADNGGLPGALLYKDNVIYPEYGVNYNEFITYLFDTANPKVLSAGTYFIGWMQHSQNSLYVGLDKNINSTGKAYYSTLGGAPGTWSASSIAGSVMLRPVFGSKLNLTGIDQSLPREQVYSIYPNPTTDYLSIISNNINGSRSLITLYDVYGNIVLKEEMANTKELDISSFKSGIYFLTIDSEGSHRIVEKLIIY